MKLAITMNANLKARIAPTFRQTFNLLTFQLSKNPKFK